MNKEYIELFTGSTDDWLKGLPAYQKKVIENMLKSADPLEVAEKWLSASTADNTAPYGTVSIARSAFFDRLLQELKQLICDSRPNNKDKKQILKFAENGKYAIAYGVADLLEPKLGMSPVLVAPAVALILNVLSNSTKAGTCAALETLITDRAAKAQRRS